MTDYKVTLTDTEDKAMSYCALSTQDWVDNALKNRARIAKEEIINLNTAHCNANNIQIATGEDAQVAQAFTLKVVKTAKEVQEETENVIKLQSISAIGASVHLAKALIDSRKKLNISNMPPGTVNTLKKEEILDLISYLTHK